MRRIRIIRMLRPLFSLTAAATLGLVAALLGIGRLVWVARVLNNAPHDITRVPGFYYVAFMHARPTVQLLTLLCAVSAFVLVHTSYRAVETTVRSAMT